jgi:hypothetical protein
MTGFSEQLLDVLEEIKGSGSFMSNDIKPFLFSGLEIRGIDEIGFPINALQAKDMIQVAHKAPFGKGSQTVLDDKVRSAWEIDATEIVFTNPEWKQFIESIIEQIKPDLGIENHSVSANLYKLLIYEEGDFFLAHKDSEKEKGMFGTLIIGLPSKHTGGELLVRFDGREEIIDFSEPSSQYEIPYAAFYADCEHEIKPITSGYRVCLVYNLVQTKGKDKIQLSHLDGYVERLTSILKTCEEDKNIPKIVLLGHQYTPSNFTMQSLKFNDRPKAEALLQAAENAGFYAKLGLVTSYQSGELEIEDRKPSRYGRRRSYYDDDYDDDEELTENGTMGEVYDESLEITHWMEEGIPPLRNISFEKEDLISGIILNGDEPVEKQAEGYTGNAGMEMQYWYHYGAIFFWPKKHQYDMLISQSTENKLEWINYYNQLWNTIKPLEIAILTKLVENCLTQNDKECKLDYTPLAHFLINLIDEKYFAKKGTEVLVQHFKRIGIDTWLKLLETYPIHHFEKIFEAVAQRQKITVTDHILKILVKLHFSEKHHNKAFFDKQINQIPAYLEGLELVSKKEKSKSVLRNVLLLSFLKNEDEIWLENTTNAFGKELTREYVNEILLGEIFSIDTYKKTNLAKQLLELSKTDLIRRINNKPQPPANWSRSMPQNIGYYKKVWTILQDFIQSPTQQFFDYTKVQAERSEMENAVRNVTIDLRMETIKKGSPHTLRLIKTQSAYEKDLADWKVDVSLLKEVEKWQA